MVEKKPKINKWIWILIAIAIIVVSGYFLLKGGNIPQPPALPN